MWVETKTQREFDLHSIGISQVAKGGVFCQKRQVFARKHQANTVWWRVHYNIFASYYQRRALKEWGIC
jgi:hypothetical protein